VYSHLAACIEDAGDGGRVSATALIVPGAWFQIQHNGGDNVSCNCGSVAGVMALGIPGVSRHYGHDSHFVGVGVDLCGHAFLPGQGRHGLNV
jgi:hypothetical protein